MCKKPNIFITHLAFELPCPCKGGALKGQHNHAKLGQVAKILSDRNKCSKHWKAGVRVTEVFLSYLVAVRETRFKNQLWKNRLSNTWHMSILFEKDLELFINYKCRMTIKMLT